MGNYRAITAVCEGVIHVLRSNYDPALFDGSPLEFEIYLANDFATGNSMSAGVSLFLYRVVSNGQHRSPAGRLGPLGEKFKTKLPINLHFLLTAWGQDASYQHSIVGWMMRTLEDTPLLSAGALNTLSPGTFHPTELVEVLLAPLETEDLLRIWETMVQSNYQISVPYVARNVRIDSLEELPANGGLVQEHIFDYHEVETV